MSKASVILIIIVISALILVVIITNDRNEAIKEIWRGSPCDTLQNKYNMWHNINSRTLIDIGWYEEILYRELMEEQNCP